MPLPIQSAVHNAVVLCIDDDPAILECEQRFLESFGYRVLTALSGSKGVELASIHSVDLVIVDYYMPEMNGVGGCRRNQTSKTACAHHHAFRRG